MIVETKFFSFKAGGFIRVSSSGPQKQVEITNCTFVGDIDNLRELRNSLKHDEALSDIGKADLLHLYTKMNKYLFKEFVKFSLF